MSTKSIVAILFGFLLTTSVGHANVILDEGVVYDFRIINNNPSIAVTAGDLVLCESTVLSCSVSTPTSQWSDVVVFYSATKGPFTTDTTFDANTAYVFSDDDSNGSFGGLANFLANYGSLSANASFLSENPTGPTVYASAYTINSSEVPEPTSYALILSGFGALAAIRWRRRS